MRTHRLLVVLIGVTLCAVALNAAADDYYIDPANGSDTTGNGTQGKPWKTITHALDNVSGSAGDPAILHAAAGTYAASRNGETFPLNMESYASLVGEGRTTTILDAESAAYHVIYCNAADGFTVEGFTITGGNANGSDKNSYGGGISCLYSSPTIRNNTITGNSALVRGGGVHCEQSSPTIDNNTISGNAAGRGGGISCGWYSSPMIRNNTITGNTANDGPGDGLSWRNDSSRKTGIDAATGATPRYGGGIECFDHSSPTISNNTISSNTANQDGGGMCCGYRSSATVSNNTISGNRAVGSLGVGGAIECWYQSPLTISNNTITGNTAYRAGGIYTSTSAVNVSDNTITGNSQAGISVTYQASPTISNNLIVGNTASGIECWYQSTPTISNNTIAGNPTNGIASYNSTPTIINCIIWANGDDLNGCSATFCCIEDNDAGEGNIHDNPLFVPGPLGDYYLSHAGVNELRIADCGLRKLSDADTNSSSIYNEMGYGPQMIDRLPTANCQLPTGKNAKETQMTRATLPVLLLVATLASVFPMNAQATDWYVDPVNGSNSNGGTSWADAWKTITFAASQTNGTGTEANPTVINLATGTYSPSSNGETFPINLGAHNDYCSLIGAGSERTILAANGSSLVVNSNAVAYQVTVTDLTITGGKGGIFHRLGEPGEPHGYFTLERCRISGNTDGCAVHTTNDGTVTIRQCVITDNYSSTPDCPGLRLSYYNNPLNLTIENCDISNNTHVSPGKDGGGAYIVGWSGRISGCRFTGNSCPRRGGGLMSGFGQGLVENCVFSGNSGGEGGGIYAGGGDRTTYQNCLISDNTCTIDGGGVFVDVVLSFRASIVQIVNCTIADNQGCGVRVEDPINEWYSEAYLYNCVIWGQDQSVVGVDCPMISHCDLSDAQCRGQNGNICAEPLFVTGEHGDYYLSHAGVNQLRIADCGLRQLSDADTNSSSIYNEMGCGPQMIDRLPTANCQLPTGKNAKETEMRRATLPVLLLAATLASVMPMNAIASDWYVDPVSGSNSNGGTSWADAWKTITYAEASTTEEYECSLHLAPGVYSPSSNGESIPIEYQRGGASLLGSGAEVTIIDGEGIYRPLEVVCGHGTLADLTITGGDNVSTMGGGVKLYADPGPLLVERCVIRDNNNGPGIYTGNWTTLQIADCQIIRNNDHGTGGGIDLGYWNGLTMTNCLIAENTIPESSNYGGGIMSQSNNYITLTNCAVVNNSKKGLFIHSADTGRVRLYNCVFWGNEDDLDVTGTELIISHCDILDGDGLGSDGNISEDPLFVTGPEGDYYLSHAGVNGKEGGGEHEMRLFGVRRLDAALDRRGLTRRISGNDLSPAPQAEASSEVSIRGRCQATANESGVEPPHSKTSRTANLQPRTHIAEETEMKGLTLPVLLLVATLASVIPTDALATDYYVDAVNGSNSNGGTSWADAWKTLTYAASQTNGTGTEGDPCVIHLAAGTYSPSSNGESFRINLGVCNDRCSLVGAGSDVTIIDAEGTGRVLDTEAYRLTITDLTITGGSVGGINHYICDAGYFTLERCVITGNTGEQAIFVTEEGRITMKHCLITDNTSGMVGAGMRTIAFWVSLDIQDCEFSDNTATDPHGTAGGGANIANWSGRISRCRFTGNSALEKGGGLMSIGGDGGVVQDCVFSGNSAGEGAGIYAGWSDRSTFQNCLITDNTCTVDGGGIFVDVTIGYPPSFVPIINCTIVDNEGCGVRLEDPINEWYSEAYLYNCVIWGQDQSVVGVDCPMISHCDLSDAQCRGQNGNICAEPLFVTGEHGDYYLSHAGVNQLRIADCGLRDLSHADTNSSSLYKEMGYHPQINHELPTGNCKQPTASCQLTSANNAKETKMRRAALPVLILAATLASVFPMNAQATDWYVDPVNGSNSNGGTSWADAWKTLTYATAQTNETGTEEDPCVIHAAAGVYSASTNGETFPINFNQWGAGYLPHSGRLVGHGMESTVLDAEGADEVLYAPGCYMTVSDLTVTGGYGGGMHAAIGSPGVGSGSYTIERCAIRDNYGGKGLYVTSGGTMEINDCVFTGNTFTGSSRGGVIEFQFFSGFGVKMDNCIVINNSVVGSDSGAIYLPERVDATLTNCTIANNSIYGIYADGLHFGVKLYNCVVWDNEDDIEVRGGMPFNIYHSDVSDGDGAGSDGNISEEPLFVTGPGGDEYLSHYETQGVDSPCIDAGDRPSSDLGLDAYTTCTDGRPDTGTVDMGYHYSVMPTLSDPTHSPDQGRTDVSFTFTAHYYSPGGSVPSSIEVVVNGTAHGMSLQSGGAADGTYGWTGTIPEGGQATYHFEATDSLAQYVRLPASGELDGPMVYDDYVKPQSSCSTDDITKTSTITVNYTSSDDNSGVAEIALWMQYEGHGYYDSGQSSADPDGSFAVDLGSGSGTYDFYTIATDRATNEEDAPGAPDASVVYDNVPPTSSASCQDSTNSSPIDVDFTASDGLTGVFETALWYRYEGGAWTDSGQTLVGDAGAFSFNLAAGEGTYQFYTISTDVAGNVESAPGSADCSLAYDCTAPVSSCDCSPWVNVRQWISVWFTAGDNLAGLDSISLWFRPLPSGSWTEYDTTEGQASGSFSFDLPGGVNDVEFYTIATDNAGNVEAPPGTADCAMGYDAVKPQSSCTSPAMCNQGTIPVDFTASDDRSGLASTTLLFKYNDGGWGTGGSDPQTGTSGQFQFDPYLGDGTYYFATRALDNAGNEEDFTSNADSQTVLDQTAPVSSCSVGVEYTSAATIAVQYSSSDALTGVALVRLFASRNGSAWVETGLESDEASGEFVYDFAGLEGTYRLLAVGTDGAGNVEAKLASRASTVVYDATLPTSTCASPEAENDPRIPIDFEVQDALAGGSGVMLYFCFSEDDAPTSVLALDWEYSGEYEYGAAGTIDYEPPYGAGVYQFFTLGRDRAGNLEAMKDTADCATDYNPDYALSTCWAAGEASNGTIDVEYEVDVGEAGLDHVELWYLFSPGGADWPGEWLDSGVTSDDSEGTLVFEVPHGDGYYRFCTIAFNEYMLEEPFPSVHDCQVVVDATVPSSSLVGPTVAPSVPVEMSFSATDLSQEGRFFSGVESVEVWYSFEGESTLCQTFEFEAATTATGVVEFAPAQEGIYLLWSIGEDAFGNRELTPMNPDMRLAVDLTPPVSSVSCPAYSQSFPVTVSSAATDSVTEVTGVSVYYSLDGGDWLLAANVPGSGGTLGFTPDDPVEGVYGFVSVARDLAGHEEVMRGAPDAETIVDWTAPDASVSGPQYANTSPISLNYEASDSLAGVAEVVLYHRPPGAEDWADTGLSFSQASDTFHYSPVSGDGAYQFAVVAKDMAGNGGGVPPSAQTTTVYDTAAPSSAASSPAYSKTRGVQVSYTASDPTSGVASVRLWYQRDGGAWVDSGLSNTAGAGEFQFTAPADGSFGFGTVALDVAGNRESLPDAPDGTTVVDTIKPASSCESPAMARQLPIAVTFTAADGTSGVSSVALWYKRDGGSWTDSGLSSGGTGGSFNFSPEEHPDGRYGFATRARDLAGNLESLPSAADCSTLFDTVAPVSSCECASEVRRFPVVVSYTGSDASSGLASVALWYQFNGGAWVNSGLSAGAASASFSFTPGEELEGMYGFATRARDNAGNVEALPDTADCTVEVVFTRPRIQVEPASVDFGEVRVGKTGSEDILITNVGDGELQVSAIREQAAGFSLSFGLSKPPFPIAPGDSASFSIEFLPRSARSYTGDLTIESNDSDTPQVTVGMGGVGRLPTGLALSVATDAETYGFDDTIDITVAAENDGDGVAADVYLALVYDLGGPEELFWSAVGFDGWQDGIIAWLPNAYLETDLSIEATLYDMPLPEFVLGQPRAGQYRVLLAAFEPGTFNWMSNLASKTLEVQSNAFFEVLLSNSRPSMGDMLSISLRVAISNETLHGDFYLVVLDPWGQLWSVTGDGLWGMGVYPWFSDIYLPGGLETTLEDFWQLTLPVSPFDKLGRYIFLTGATEPGTLAPLSDIGVTELTIVE